MKTPSSWILTACLASSLAQAQAPDFILYNGKIFTSNAEQLWVEALAIRGEQVSAIGTNDSIRQMAGAQTVQYDLAATHRFFADSLVRENRTLLCVRTSRNPVPADPEAQRGKTATGFKKESL